MTGPFWIVVFAALTFGVGFLVVRWLTRRGAAEYRREGARLGTVSSLSFEDAAAKARALLTDTAVFRAVDSPSRDDGSLDSLAPEIRKLLQRYESIELAKGPGAHVGRSMIGPSAHKKDFLRIGDISSGTDVEGEIAVRPGEETIYELHPHEAPDPTFGTYRSIHHWIVAIAGESK